MKDTDIKMFLDIWDTCLKQFNFQKKISRIKFTGQWILSTRFHSKALNKLLDFKNQTRAGVYETLCP